MEQARGPVRIACAVGEPAPEEAVPARHAIGAIAPARERGANRGRELLAHALVGVEAQHPVVARDRHRVLLLAPEAEPLLALHARAVALGDRPRVVGAPRVDHQDLVGELRARQAWADLRAGVEGDDGDGEGELVGGNSRHGEWDTREGSSFYPESWD